MKPTQHFINNKQSVKPWRSQTSTDTSLTLGYRDGINDPSTTPKDMNFINFLHVFKTYELDQQSPCTRLSEQITLLNQQSRAPYLNLDYNVKKLHLTLCRADSFL